MPLDLVTTQSASLATHAPAADLGSCAHEILGRTPPWILRSGTWVVAGGVTVLLLLACHFYIVAFRYIHVGYYLFYGRYYFVGAVAFGYIAG